MDLKNLNGISLPNTTSTKSVSLSSDRCPTCKRKFIQEGDGEPFCFYCKIIADEDKRLAEETAKAHNEMIMRKFTGDSLMNERLANCSFDNYMPASPELDRAKLVVMKYANNFSKDNPVNLMLIGNYGTGKSHLAVSAVKVLLTRGKSCLFISVPKLFTKLKSTYNSDSKETEAELLSHLEKMDLLVLDDVGAEKSTEENKEYSWAKTKMFEIVDSRIGKHTIFTTNFSVEELLAMYGERNFSRMMENTHVEKMNGENYRLREFK